ncbi:MAG: hypothetical protein AB7U44_08485 [Sulfuricurvum sp.]
MRIYLLSAVLCSLLLGDEIQRIESIVNDITKLRSEYDECRRQLDAKTPHVLKSDLVLEEAKPLRCEAEEEEIDTLKRLLEDTRQKNTLLQEELEKANGLFEIEKQHRVKLEELEKSNKEKEKALKIKDAADKKTEEDYLALLMEKEKYIIYLENQIKNKEKTSKKEEKTVSVLPANCQEETNPFPKLVLKEQYKDTTPAKSHNVQPLPVDTTTVLQEELQTPKEETLKTPADDLSVPEKVVVQITEPSAFKLAKESEIYDAPKGKMLEKWEEGTSFTSNKKYKNWIKITGYFIDKKWKPSKEELWILEENVVKK